MHFFTFLLAFNLLISSQTSAQNAKFDFTAFISDSVETWTTKTVNSHLKCFEMCKGLRLLQLPLPTLPPFYSKVTYNYKLFSNCSVEIRELKPISQSWLRKIDIVQIGGLQYHFPLPLKLPYFAAQKFCRSKGLDLSFFKNTLQDSYIIASYLQYFATLDETNNATIRGNLTFWDGRDQTGIDRSLKCPTFSMNMSHFRGMIANRSSEQCKTPSLFYCEVPLIYYKDSCRLGFISRFKATPPGSTLMLTTVRGATTTTPMPFICEQCHLNHTVLFARPCPEIECPTCWGITPSESVKGKECAGKFYEYFSGKWNYKAANSFCCEKGMRSASVTTNDEAECIRELLSPSIPFAWASGTQLGKDCQGRYTWCDGKNNEAINSLNRFTFDLSSQGESGDCIGLTIKTILNNEQVLAAVPKPCSSTGGVLCEAYASWNQVKTTTVSKRGGICEGKVDKCPKPEQFAIKEKTIYSYENTEFNKGAANTEYICDKSYNIELKSTGAFDAAVKVCLERRLDLAYVESFKDVLCIRDFILRKHPDEQNTMYFWLKGQDKSCPRDVDGPTWCSTGATIGSQFVKPASEAGNRCVLMDMRGTKVNINTGACDRLGYGFVCMEKCPYPTCPKLNCEISLSPTGLTKPNCPNQNVNYMVVSERKNMTEAMEYCCKHGMALVSLETPEKFNCLLTLLRQSYSQSGNPRYWTSGTDMNCKGKFAWCGTGEMFLRESYHSFFAATGGEPDDADPDQNCVAIIPANAPGRIFKHEACYEKNSFVCELVGKYARNYIGPVSPSHRTSFNATFF